MPLYKSVVGPKGQITLPKDLRERFHLHEGEDVVIFDEEEGLLVKHPPSSLYGRLRGALDYRGIERDVVRLRAAWTIQST
ncbi:MAG: AbrB/MazE/SpoVT family DNA-binding domain-containing protein [Euryarchaeota archaeon]|nr:AbrB/MazE/SpoVT family DNA-binding domain-containing protein [Euryarchaeota archaeon]